MDTLEVGKKYRLKTYKQLCEEYGTDSRGFIRYPNGFNYQMELLCGMKIFDTATQHIRNLLL